MPTPLEILKESEKEFQKECVLRCSDGDIMKDISPRKAQAHLKSLTIKLLEGEIERKNKLLKLIGKPEGFGEVQTWAKGRRELVEEDIAYIESQLSEIKKI